MPSMQLNREKLLDKLCERWLFEKKGVELYDAIIQKLEGLDFQGNVGKLYEFRDEEKNHQRLLEEYIEKVGGSTRKRTPSQMLVEQESRAFENIVSESDDPSHLLHVLLDAELEDNASWELLIQLARRVGQRDFISKFREAIAHEKEHLRGIKQMVTKFARQELVEQANV